MEFLLYVFGRFNQGGEFRDLKKKTLSQNLLWIAEGLFD